MELIKPFSNPRIYFFCDFAYGMFASQDEKPKARMKAAETRAMLPVLRHMLTEIFPPQSEHDHLRLNALIAIDDFYVELFRWRNEGVDTRLKCIELGKRHLLMYAELGLEALQSERCRASGNWLRWRIYPKHHLFIHLLEEQMMTIGNPIECWAYGDEDFIGASVIVAKRCHAKYVVKVVVRIMMLLPC